MTKAFAGLMVEERPDKRPDRTEQTPFLVCALFPLGSIHGIYGEPDEPGPGYHRAHRRDDRSSNRSASPEPGRPHYPRHRLVWLEPGCPLLSADVLACTHLRRTRLDRRYRAVPTSPRPAQFPADPPRVPEGSTVRARIRELSLIHISEPTRRTPISYA